MAMLADAGIIEQSTALVTIRDPAMLRELACECVEEYTPRQLFNKIH
jgi:hypothetical protein